MAIFWEEDFVDGTQGNLSNFGSQCSIVAPGFLDIDYCHQCEYTARGTAEYSSHSDFSPDNSTIYIRFNHKVSDGGRYKSIVNPKRVKVRAFDPVGGVNYWNCTLHIDQFSYGGSVEGGALDTQGRVYDSDTVYNPSGTLMNPDITFPLVPNQRFKYQSNRWYTFEYMIKRDTFGVDNDGEMKMWVNGVLHWHLSGLKLDWTGTNWNPNTIYWNDYTAYTTIDPPVYSWLDNLAISNTRIYGVGTDPVPPSNVRSNLETMWFDNFDTYTNGTIISAYGYGNCLRSIVDNTRFNSSPNSVRCEARVADGTAFGAWGWQKNFNTSDYIRIGDTIRITLDCYYPSSFDLSTGNSLGLKFIRIGRKNALGNHLGTNDLLINKPGSELNIGCEGLNDGIKTVQYRQYTFNPPRDEWFNLGFEFTAGTIKASEGGTARMAIILNGVNVFEVTDLITFNSTTDYCDYTQLYTYWNNGVPQDQDCWHDNYNIQVIRA